MRKPKPIPTPAETIERLQAEISARDARLAHSSQARRALSDENATLRATVKAQAAALILFEDRRAEAEIPF